jgi:hypothetical protein
MCSMQGLLVRRHAEPGGAACASSACTGLHMFLTTLSPHVQIALQDAKEQLVTQQAETSCTACVSLTCTKKHMNLTTIGLHVQVAL